MSDIKKCPCVQDIYEQDCGFPDCMGGWDTVYKDRLEEISQLQTENERLQGELDGIRTRASNMAFELKRFPEPRILVSVILEMLEVLQETPNES